MNLPIDIETNCEENKDKTEKYVIKILKSEAKMNKCLTKLFCDNLAEDLKKVHDPEKKARILKEILCAYSCKDKSMADVIRSLSCISPKKYSFCNCYSCCNNSKSCDNNFNCCNDDLLILVLLLLLFCNCNRC